MNSRPEGDSMSALVDEHRLEAEPTGDPKLPRIDPPTSEIKQHLRSAKTLWCPGCSDGTITRALIDAVLGLEIDPEKVVVVAGSAAAAASAPTSTTRRCTPHTGGRCAVATGVKAADPSLHVIVAMGDGDSSAIGGNHFIHAARRNIDLTALVFNNSIYGMTGGQISPTTHLGDKSTTSVYGNIEPAFDLCELAHAAEPPTSPAAPPGATSSWPTSSPAASPTAASPWSRRCRSAPSTTGASTSPPTRRSS